MEKQTAGKQQLGDFAPKFAELNDDVLFGEVWSREDKLSPRDRSLATISALLASGAPEFALRAHLEMGRQNGLTRTEVAELITHLAFYAGWPKAWAAFNLAKEVYTLEVDELADFRAKSTFPVGEYNEAYAQYFTGRSYLNMLVTPAGGNTIAIGNVSFEPGCRNFWHTHQAEQILLVTEGIGYYQEWGKPAQKLQPGDVVVIAPGVKHWHGASSTDWFAHLAISDTAKGGTTWHEAVDEDSYREAQA